MLPPPAALLAQATAYDTPPKLLRQAAASTPVPAAGKVTVRVFIRSDGTVGSAKVQTSTNHADDAAALAIARTSTFRPASRGARPVGAYYTMALRLSPSSPVADAGPPNTDVDAANALVRAGKYDEARTKLQTFLSAHPGDPGANALLGVADAYLNDAAGSAAAFDATGGKIPENFKNVAAKAYSDAALEALKAKHASQAIAFGKKALALRSDVNTMYIVGTAYANAQQWADAGALLERAKTQAVAGQADDATLNAIDSSLVTVYLFGGQADKGILLAKALKNRQPSNLRVDDALASYYNEQAVGALKAGNRDRAAALLETGAAAAPSHAVTLYVQAANALSQGTNVSWLQVLAEARKALSVDSNDARANYVAGIAAANAGDTTSAGTFLRAAKANAGNDAALGADIAGALKKLGLQ